MLVGKFALPARLALVLCCALFWLLLLALVFEQLQITLVNGWGSQTAAELGNGGVVELCLGTPDTGMMAGVGWLCGVYLIKTV